MRKIVTFLGRRPQAILYEFNGQVYFGSLFAEAMRQFLVFDQMLVCTTPEAHHDAWPVLEALHDPKILEVPITKGENTQEMWGWFDQLLQHVNQEDEVIFDITHGLRSIPFLIFLFAAYLKTARKVTIAGIYYGAFELGDRQTNKPAPVIDLSEFISMVDWLTASDRFIRFGDSTDLAGLVHQTGDYREDHPLTRATHALDSLSQALRLIRPLNAMQISAQLPGLLEEARFQAEAVLSTRPYVYLVEDLKQAYAPFAQADPLDTAHLPDCLAKQRDLITWYIDHQQWVQGISLAREWLITWIIWQLGETDFINQPLRESIAETMSKEALRRKDAKDQQRPFQPLFLRDIPEIASVLGDWLCLAGIRNDIDHAGMRYSSQEADHLIKSIRTLCSKLHRLPLDKSIIDPKSKI